MSVARHPDEQTARPAFTAIWHSYPEVGWVETVDGVDELGLLSGVVQLLLQQHNIPAAQLAVMEGDELVTSMAFTRAPVAYAPITTATPLMGASVTKPMTAVAVLQAFGVGGLTDDLMDLVPAPTLMGGSKPTGITVRQALQHTSGWDIDASALDVKTQLMLDRLPTSEDWLNFMSIQPNHGIDNGKVGDFHYSNFPYEMLALALKTQHPQIPPEDPANLYESDLMKGGIFDEAGMCRTAYKRQGLLDVTITGMSEIFAEPEYGPCSGGKVCDEEFRYYLTESEHPYSSASLPLNELNQPAMFDASALDDALLVPFLRRQTYGGADAVHAYIGAGSIVTTAEDLARFMVSFRPFLDDRDAELDTALLTAAEAQAMFPASYPFGSHQPNPFNCTIAGRAEASGSNTLQACYGLGWYVGNGPGQTASEVWSHGGDVEGAVSLLMVHPETDTTVAVIFARHPFGAPWLANDVIDPFLDEIAGSGFGASQPFEPPPVHDDYDPPGYPGF